MSPGPASTSAVCPSGARMRTASPWPTSRKMIRSAVSAGVVRAVRRRAPEPRSAGSAPETGRWGTAEAPSSATQLAATPRTALPKCRTPWRLGAASGVGMQRPGEGSSPVLVPHPDGHGPLTTPSHGSPPLGGSKWNSVRWGRATPDLRDASRSPPQLLRTAHRLRLRSCNLLPMPLDELIRPLPQQQPVRDLGNLLRSGSGAGGGLDQEPLRVARGLDLLHGGRGGQQWRGANRYLCIRVYDWDGSIVVRGWRDGCSSD